MFMRNKIKEIIQAVSFSIVLLFAAAPSLAAASTPTCSNNSTKSAIQSGINSAASGDCNKQPPNTLDDTIASIVNILSVLVGVLSVIMIIVGGLRYVTSAGSPEGAKGARNTILYAIIGLIIVAFAQVIARFVLTAATNNK
jgi:beta-lactamase regulating signal transducer with metallopeptidase domain